MSKLILLPFFFVLQQSLKEQFGIDDDQIACCSSLMFKDNEEQEPYIRMVIPSEYPNGIIVAKHPTTLKVNALKLVCLSIGLWGGGGGGG